MKKLLLPVLFLLITAPTFAQLGILDSTFNQTGIFAHDFGFQDNITDVKVDSYSRIVSVGTAITPAFAGNLLVTRLTDDGVFDTSFAGTGYVVVPDFTESYAYECLIRNDGKIIVAGARADAGYLFASLVMRFNADGSRDTTFGIMGVAEHEVSVNDDFAYAAAEQPDGKILLAGTYKDANFNNALYVMRLMQDGAVDSTFGVNGVATIAVANEDNELTSILIQPDGKIVVSGHYDSGLTGSGQFDFDIIIARFNTDGTPDTGFGTNGKTITAYSANYVDDAFGMELDPYGNGKILVSGFTTLPDFSFNALLVQYDSTGVVDQNFGTNGFVEFDNAVNDVSMDVLFDPSGWILMAGTSGGFFFDDRDFLLARYDMSGNPDVNFGTNGFVLTSIYTAFDEANAITFDNSFRVLLAGKGNNGSQNDMAVVRYLYNIPFGTSEQSESAFSIYPNPVIQGQALNISFEKALSGPITCEMYTVQGSLVSQWENVSGVQDQLELPATTAPGMYFLRLFSGSSPLGSARVIIEE